MNPFIEILQERLRRKRVDALLVSQPENRRFLSSYTAHDTSINGSSGFLLIPKTGQPYLITDSRFELEAAQEAEGFEIILYPRGLFDLLKKTLPSLHIKSLAFESDYFLVSSAKKLEEMAVTAGITLVPLEGFIENFRVLKQKSEIKKIKKAVLLNEKIFQEVYKGLRPGQTEKEIAIRIENAMRLNGAERPSFETIVAGGPNGAKPHAVPSSRKIKKKEPIIIDMGLVLNGYCSDMTRTVVLGTPSTKTIKIFRLVRKAQLAGIQAIAPGVICNKVDSAARNIIAAAGYGPHFGHGLGHGVGLAVHEAPSLSRRARKKLSPGMVVTVEPGIYLPDWGGVRLENMVVVTKKGNKVLNTDTTMLDI